MKAKPSAIRSQSSKKSNALDFSTKALKKGILYAHVREDNKNYVTDQAKKQKIHLSTYMDKLITHLRSVGTI